MSNINTIEEAFLLKLTNNDIVMEHNKKLVEILKEREDIVDFVKIKKGYAFNKVLSDFFFLEKIEVEKIEEDNKLIFIMNNNSHSSKITKKIPSKNQKLLEELFNDIKETQKNTISNANKLMIKVNREEESLTLHIYQKETRNGILTDFSYTGIPQGIEQKKIVSSKEINESDTIKINNLKMKYLGSNPTLKKTYFEVNKVILDFENDLNFVELLLEKGQVIKNTEKRKLKY